MNLGEVEGALRMRDEASGALKNVLGLFGGVIKQGNEAGKATASLGSSLSGLGPAALALGAVGAGALAAFAGIQKLFGSVQGFINTTFDMNSTLETTTLQFETLFKNADLAKEHVAGLFEFAKKTPFETQPILDASRTLQTFGGVTLNTLDNIRKLGDASAAVTSPIENVAFWTGRLYSALKGGQPIGEAAIRLQELAVLTPQARREIEHIMKTTKDADKAFAAFSKSLDQFSGAMEKQEKSWKGVTSTMRDIINLTIAAVGKPLFEAVRDAVGMVNQLANHPLFATLQTFATEAMQKLVDAAKRAGAAILEFGQYLYAQGAQIYQRFIPAIDAVIESLSGWYDWAKRIVTAVLEIDAVLGKDVLDIIVESWKNFADALSLAFEAGQEVNKLFWELARNLGIDDLIIEAFIGTLKAFGVVLHAVLVIVKEFTKWVGEGIHLLREFLGLSADMPDPPEPPKEFNNEVEKGTGLLKKMAEAQAYAADQDQKRAAALNKARAEAEKYAKEVERIRDGLSGKAEFAGLEKTMKAIAGIKLGIDGIDPSKLKGIAEQLEHALTTLDHADAKTKARLADLAAAWFDLLTKIQPVIKAQQENEEVAKSMAKAAEAGIDAVSKRFDTFADRADEVSESIRKLNLELGQKSMLRKASDEARQIVARWTEWEDRQAELNEEISRSTPAMQAMLEQLRRLEQQDAEEDIQQIVYQMEEMRATLLLLVPMFPSLLGAISEFEDKGKGAVDNTTQSTFALHDALGGLAGAFRDLAQISGEGLDGTIGKIAELIGLMQVGSQAGKLFSDTFSKPVKDAAGNIIGKKWDFGALAGEGGAGATAGAYTNAALSAVQGYGSMQQATDVRGRGNRALRGAATGAAIGTQIMPGWGTAIGAVVGAVWGAVRNPMWEEAINRSAIKFGKEISEELARAVEASAKENFKKDLFAAEVFNLDKFIAEFGIKPSTLEKFNQQLHDAFSMREAGKFTQEQLEEVLNKNFGQLAKGVVDSGKIASKTFQDLIRLNQQFGTESKEVMAFVMEQAGRIGDNLGTMIRPFLEQFAGSKDKIKELADAKAEIEAKMKELRGSEEDLGIGDTEELAKLAAELAKINEEATKLHTDVLGGAEGAQQAFDDLGIIAVGSFNAMLAAGMTYVEAIDQLGPGLDQLIALQDELGLSGSVAFEELIKFRELVTANEALVNSAGALNETLLAMSNIGALNTETLAALERQGVSTFDRLVAAGFTEKQALMQMEKFLQNVIDAHEQLGVPIDENTQRLIDQAREAGLLGDKAKTQTDIMKEGFNEVTDALWEMVRVLGGEVPQAVQDAANAVKNTKIPPVVIPVEIEFPEGRSPWDEDYERYPPGERPPPSRNNPGGVQTAGMGFDGLPTEGGMPRIQQTNVYLDNETIAAGVQKVWGDRLDVYTSRANP